MFRKKLTINENERVLVFKNQKLTEVLTTGKHQFWDFKNELTFELADINDVFFTGDSAERLYNDYELLRQHVGHQKVAEDEVGLMYLNDMLLGVIAPNENAYFWQAAGDIRIERVSLTDDIAVDNKTLQAINRAGANMASRLIRSNSTVAVQPVAQISVPNNHLGLLYINGELVRELTAGQYGYWQFNDVIDVRLFDCREQVLDISGQEILSKDRVSLRINLSANIRITDAALAAKSVDKVDDFVYKTLQLALREAVGTKTLDDILIDKLYVNETVKELVTQRLLNLGISLVSVGVKDVILPGEMKAILNQVVEAQKAAEANVIKRREETSATRSLHNTAKVMENNPTLMRLKELEALEKVADKIDSLTVYGGLEGLMNNVVKIAD